MNEALAGGVYTRKILDQQDICLLQNRGLGKLSQKGKVMKCESCGRETTGLGSAGKNLCAFCMHTWLIENKKEELNRIREQELSFIRRTQEFYRKGN